MLDTTNDGNGAASNTLEAPNKIDLDGCYTPDITANWLHTTRRSLLDMAKRGEIPVIKLNQRVLRFHPRSILLSKGAKV